MKKREFHVPIKNYFLCKKTSLKYHITEAKERLGKYYGDSTIDFNGFKEWFTSASDAECPVPPKEVDMCRVKVCEVAEAVDISTGRVHHISHGHEKAIHMLGTMIAHARDHKRNRIWRRSAAIRTSFVTVDTSQHQGDQGTIN